MGSWLICKREELKRRHTLAKAQAQVQAVHLTLVAKFVVVSFVYEDWHRASVTE
jgi:hypothetical protein